MKYSFEEKIQYELSRRTTMDSQREFFRNAVNRLRFAKSITKLLTDHEFSCEFLSRSGYCLQWRCQNCLIDKMFNNSLEDFKLGIK